MLSMSGISIVGELIKSESGAEVLGSRGISKLEFVEAKGSNLGELSSSNKDIKDFGTFVVSSVRLLLPRMPPAVDREGALSCEPSDSLVPGAKVLGKWVLLVTISLKRDSGVEWLYWTVSAVIV